MGFVIISFGIPLGIILFIWGGLICLRAKALVGSVDVRGNSARLIGLGAMLFGAFTAIVPCTFVGRYDMGFGQFGLYFTSHWPAVLGAVLAWIGIVLLVVGIRTRQWQFVGYGSILFLLGILLMFQLKVVERSFFQLLGRKAY